MPFNPKTYNLRDKGSIVDTWSEVAERLAGGESRVLVPLQSRRDAYKYLHQFNRVRVALRHQARIFEYADIIANVEPVNEEWCITFRLREQAKEIPPFKVKS